MTSTTSFRNFLREWKALYVWNLRRSRGMSLLYFGLLLLAGPALTFLVCGVSSFPERMLGNIVPTNSGLSIPLTMIFTLVFAIQRFSYMHNKRSVDLYHAMPVRRGSMLLASWSASLTGLLLPLLADILLLLLTNAWFAKGAWYNIPLESILSYFGGQMFMAAVCLTFCMLMAVCSGTVMDMVISIVLTNCSFPLVILMVMLLGSWLLPGFDGNYSLTLITALAPFPAMVIAFILQGGLYFNLFGAYYSFPHDSLPLFWGWWVLLFVVMLVASFWLYTRRKSESAENDLAFPVPKVLLRFLCSAAVGLLAGMVFFLVNNDTVSFFIGFLLFSIMAHAVAEALYSRGLRRFVRTLPSYGVMVLCVVALYLSAATGFFGYDTRVPQNVTQASMQCYDLSYQSNDLSPEINPLTLLSAENEPLARRDSVQMKEPENIKIIQNIHQELLHLRKLEGSPLYSFCTGGVEAAITYETPQGNLVRNFRYYNTDTRRLHELGQQLVNTSEWKQQSLPYVIDPQGIHKLYINTNTPLYTAGEYEYTENSIMEDGEVGYAETIIDPYHIEFSLTKEESKTLLGMLQKDIEAGTALEEITQSDENLSISLDASAKFRLTEDSPWYELVPEKVGEWVYQSDGLSFTATPRMENTYTYLQKLIDSRAGGNEK